MRKALTLVGVGIDTIKVNVKMLDDKAMPTLTQSVPDRLETLFHFWQDTARESKKPLKTSMTFHHARMMMLPNGSPTWKYLLKNDCIQLALVPRLTVPMIGRVTFSSAYLWSMPSVNDAVDEVHSFLMDIFGPQLLLQAAQIDLCVDVVNFKLPKDWRMLFTSRARRKQDIAPSEKDQAYYRGRELETVLFSGHGRPVSCKIYDKIAEIKQQSKKKVWFYDLWKQQGWDEEAKVMRIEFSVEREAFRQMELEDIYDALRNIKRLWAYCTQEWLRMVIPGPDKNRARWETAPQWVAIQHAFDDYGCKILDALGPLIRDRQRNADIDQLTAQIAGCSTTLAALCEELSDEDGAAEIFSIVYDKVVKRWQKLRVHPQDIVREKKFIYHQAG